jgi:hypothetical protein
MPSIQLRHVFVALSLLILLGLVRFGHLTPDSPYYLELVEYFEGGIPVNELNPPYAYRILTPWLASLIPLNPNVAFASVNLAATFVAYILFALILRQLATSQNEFNVGLTLMVISFPTVNYSSGVLTDPVGFLFLTAGALTLYFEKFILLALVASVGVLARDSVVSLSLAAWIYLFLMRDEYKSRSIWTYSFVGLVPVAFIFAIRAWLSDIPQYVWTPSFSRVSANLTRPVSWITVLLPAAPIAIVLFYGVWRRGCDRWHGLSHRQRAWTISLTSVSLLVLLYSVLSAFMSGRFVWPLYVTIIPISVIIASGTPLFNWLTAISNILFGRKL